MWRRLITDYDMVALLLDRFGTMRGGGHRPPLHGR
jgi:hypothetical protein